MPRVLICEPGRILLTALDYRMRKYGMEVVRAQTGEEALRRIHRNSVDLAVVNTRLPDFRILSFVHLIREDFRSDVPLILLSEVEEEMETVFNALEAGANDFLTIPFKPLELAMRIQLLLPVKAYDK